ncbi:MAG: hypothetical protein HY269_03600 [Deltaproteobacteria bacterium]|nr:hypothetical protein [Deltaproteobacteria bacterium]
MKTSKMFDCLKMKDEAQQRRARLLHGLSTEERLDFYRRIQDELRQRQKQARQAQAR